ncbi:hypothetical protein FKN01_32220 [Streptomyces sp. 130]|uniref:hypothetical protein n=1 Tax=Streptomyces sp. 130 TaxID=2591006 RepID=UPI00117C5020|nr:hypothetical protein [Streptomyces sp. 130]TRV70817.1 hypothetical protein FKN01_32220 [Streptomyces sp. 130]
MNVNDIVQERIQAARNRIAANKRRRDELNAARTAGLTARHAQKLRHLTTRNTNPTNQPEGPD